MIYRYELEARVALVNSVNAEIMRVCAITRRLFTPLVGQKIEKVDGQLFSKFAHLSPENIYGDFHSYEKNKFSIYRSRNDYALRWIIRSSESYKARNSEMATYYEDGFYVGDLRDGVLTNVEQSPLVLKTNYTVEGVSEQRNFIADLESKLNDAKRSIGPFLCN